jgi:ATP-dependent Clp protease ATP-binding subunit ClpB
VKLSFVLFDEVEKASDALWNLLLGVPDKATLTLGDNRQVDFSNALIFMTSNIGAAEMNSLVSPRLGFHVPTPDDRNCAPKLTAKLSRSDVEAARRKFTPEFLNHLDRIVVFRALGSEELTRIIDIELELHDRIRIAHSDESPSLTFFRETEAWETWKTKGVVAA